MIDSVPIWHQSILLSPEHDANIGGMIPGGIEVGVVSCEKNRGTRDEQAETSHVIILVAAESTSSIVTQWVSQKG